MPRGAGNRAALSVHLKHWLSLFCTFRERGRDGWMDGWMKDRKVSALSRLLSSKCTALVEAPFGTSRIFLGTF